MMRTGSTIAVGAAVLGGALLLAGATLQAAAQERGAKVVPDRPARVFVMAGFDTACKSLTPVQISIDKQPAKGAVTLREGQETTVQYSLSGTCIGSRIKGTGIYYTAKAGAAGMDTFTVTARLGSGETASRTFNVAIAED